MAKRVKLSVTAFAARARIKPATLRAYVKRNQAPQPDGREEISGTPWWWESTAKRWIGNRPGRGARTDLAR
jgi:hypothetical protein